MPAKLLFSRQYTRACRAPYNLLFSAALTGCGFALKRHLIYVLKLPESFAKSNQDGGLVAQPALSHNYKAKQ
jgi:hypothetical protein